MYDSLCADDESPYNNSLYRNRNVPLMVPLQRGTRFYLHFVVLGIVAKGKAYTQVLVFQRSVLGENDFVYIFWGFTC